jgi:hypothetical protein
MMNDVTTQVRSTRVNGLDVAALKQVIGEVAANPAKGAVRFQVKSAWQGQAKSRATVESYNIGGQEVKRLSGIGAGSRSDAVSQAAFHSQCRHASVVRG